MKFPLKLLELLDEVASEEQDEAFDKKFEIVRDALCASTTEISKTLDKI